jgi:imidazolonepropionase-like amidohydrolase
VAQAVDAGADGIEHCSCLTERGIEAPGELVERLAVNRVTVCPTLGRSLDGPELPVPGVRRRNGANWERRLAMVRVMHEAGVVIASGVDAGINRGKRHGALGGAVADLVEAGIPADDALASATSVAAAACGFGERKGWLREGCDADLAVVGGDPGTDIRALSDVRAVYLRGTRVR